MTMHYGYPIVLNLAGKRCVVVGGGRLAEEKAVALLEAGAMLTVIAPSLSPALAELAHVGRIRWLPRRYGLGDMAGMFLAIAADEDRAANAAIFAEAESLGVLMNALDDPPCCRFIFPSVVRQGSLVAAISTSGIAPALAVRLREKLQKELGPEYSEFLQLAGRWRERIAEAIPDAEKRKKLWYDLVDSEALALLKAGESQKAESLFAAMVQAASVS